MIGTVYCHSHIVQIIIIITDRIEIGRIQMESPVVLFELIAFEKIFVGT